MRPESKHSILLMMSTAVTALLSFVYSVYALNVLGPALAADYVAALTVAAFLFVALGPINGTVARFTAGFAARGDLNRVSQLQRHATRQVGLYGGAGLVVACVFAPLLSKWLNYESPLPLILAFVMVWLTLLLSVARGVMRGLERFPQYSLNTIIEAVVRLAAGVTLLYFWTSTTGGLSAFIIALIAILIVSRVQLEDVWQHRDPVTIDRDAINSYLWPMCWMMAATAAFDNLDMMVVKIAFEADAAGIYGAAFTLARGTSVLVTPFSILLLPLVAGLQARGAAVRKTVLRICLYFVALCSVPLLIFALLPSQVLTWVQLDKYASAAPLLLPLTATRLLGHLNALIALSHAALGRFRFLVIFVPALIIEIVLMAFFHDSQMTVILIAFTVQACTLIALAAYSCLFRSSSESADGRSI